MSMEENKLLKLVYEKAEEFLKKEVGKDNLKKELEHYKKLKNKFDTKEKVFKRMIESLKNKQGYSNFIAKVDEMEEILFNFEVEKIEKEYKNDYKKLFDKFKNKFGKEFKSMNKDNKRNAWVIYSKGILSCSKFLNNF